ncbi:TetR/AcrR family transcriptional regulator [Aeromicrobium wangtongii]|nr:TetR/AcrR family transcriptional regulator [Aeromicrobium wangtongii]MCL3818592.1 TetR/AcrR family transcriptional regulator [Aeromicrobium wangtongii]
MGSDAVVAKEASGGLSTPPTPKGRDARRRLLEAGEQLFGEQGYAGTRVSDITEAANLSPGAFYRYFKDRHELLLVLLTEMLDRAFDFARARWDDNHPTESVQRTTERYLEFYDLNRAMMGVMVEMAQNDEEVRSVWRQSRTAFYTRIGRALTRGVTSGAIRSDIDVEVAAELLGSMTEFYAFQRYALDGDALKDVPPVEVATTLAELWTRGVASK